MNNEPKPLELQGNTSPLEVADDENLMHGKQMPVNETENDRNEVSESEIGEIFTDRLNHVESILTDLKQLFEQRLQHDSVKEKAFDTLYAKLEHQERRFEASLKDSLIRSLLLLYDNIYQTQVDLESVHSPVCGRVKSLKQELLNILYSEDVEPIGKLERFNDQQQKVTGNVATDDPTQNGSIESVVREGFMFQGKVLRPQSVVIRRYQPPISNSLQLDN
ncbi:MAG: nucleotide exchange factor GrpE [Kovacikia sp.]